MEKEVRLLDQSASSVLAEGSLEEAQGKVSEDAQESNWEVYERLSSQGLFQEGERLGCGL
jgi:hypothetical protein